MNVYKTVAALCVILFVGGCSSAPPKSGPSSPAAEKPAPKPPELATGREAFQKLYPAARLWAADARPVRMESQPNKDANGHDGKSAVWRAQFASPARGGIQSFLWSGTSSDDAPERGVTHSSEDSWTPSNASTQPFDIAFLKIDSDAAFAVAQKHGGEKVLQANSNLPVLHVLNWDGHKSQLVWQVIYGVSHDDAKLVVDVDASSGVFVRAEK
jgi:hypothetical protein